MCLSKGGFTQTTIDDKQILRNAILLGASGIILSHNHLTDDPRPSKAIDIQLLDHIIIANSSYYSFSEDRKSPYNETILSTLAAA